jgi:tetratricopeptide (TPR) repeat protein
MGAWFSPQPANAADVSAWCPQGQKSFNGGQFEAANLALNSCLNSPPDNPEVAAEGYLLRGETYLRGLVYKAALSDLDRAVELSPANADAWRVKAWISYKLKDFHGGVTAIDESLQIDPLSTESHHIHAQILTAMGRQNAAMDAYDMAYSFEDQGTVQTLQQSLENQDYEIGPIDGVYGSRTRDALKACIADGCSISL